MGRMTRWGALLLMVGCEWMLPEVREVDKPVSPWVEQEAEVDLSNQEVRTDVRVPGRFDVAEVDVDITVNIGGRPTHHHVQTKMGALQVADVPTMTYPTGFVLFDVDTWTVDEEPGWARTIRKGYLSTDVGDQVQLSFDISSIGKLNGELMEAGDSARGVMIGSLQVEGRVVTLTFPTVFELHADNMLVIRSDKPIPVDLKTLKRDERLDLVRQALEVKMIDTQVFVEFSMKGTPVDTPLPTFARTPVTMRSAEKMRRDLDAEYDPVDAFRKSLKNSNSNLEVPDGVRNEDISAVMKAIEERRRRGVATGQMPVPSKPKPTKNRR